MILKPNRAKSFKILNSMEANLKSTILYARETKACGDWYGYARQPKSYLQTTSQQSSFMGTCVGLLSSLIIANSKSIVPCFVRIVFHIFTSEE